MVHGHLGAHKDPLGSLKSFNSLQDQGPVLQRNRSSKETPWRSHGQAAARLGLDPGPELHFPSATKSCQRPAGPSLHGDKEVPAPATAAPQAPQRDSPFCQDRWLPWWWQARLDHGGLGRCCEDTGLATLPGSLIPGREE